MSVDPAMTALNSCTIAIDGTKSTVICKKHYHTIALFLPANWITGTITFEGCTTGDGTFVPVVQGTDAAAVTVASVAASKCVVLDGAIAEALKGVPYIKLVAGAAQTTTVKTIEYILIR